MAPFGQVSLRFVGSYCGPLLRWPDRQQAALAFDHDIAGIGCGRRDQRDPAAAVMDQSTVGTLETSILQFTRTMFSTGRDNALHGNRALPASYPGSLIR